MENIDFMTILGGVIGFGGLVSVVFIVLRLLGKIGWPLIWVFSPFWIVTAVVILVLAVVGFVVVSALDR